MQDWETLIAERTEAHRDSYKPQRIDDARIRNMKAAQKRIFKAHYDEDPQHFITLSEQWKKEHPEANRAHQKNYRIRHKDDPIYKAKKAKWNRDYRLRKKENQAA